MPRKNKRKVYTIGKEAVFFAGAANGALQNGCVGCAFAGYGGVCTTSDGACLKMVRSEPKLKEAGNAVTER